MMLTELTCLHCRKLFKRQSSLHKRSQRRGVNNIFCSCSCAVKHHHKHSSPWWNMKGLKSDNRKDRLTRFRIFTQMARSRDSEADITPEYLEEIWNKQNGECPICGEKLLLPDGAKTRWKNGKAWNNASIDRIDNEIGYEKGNVRFVSLMANLAKNSFPGADLIKFCTKVVKNQTP